MGSEQDAGRTPRSRLDHVDGIRALAAGFVVLHHIWITTYPEYPANTGPWAVGWLVYGHLAVAVFIVVSGFSLAIAPARRDWRLGTGGVRTFLRRRAWRILPTYWAALVLSCLVFGAVTPDLTGDKVDAKAVVVHALLLQDVVNSPKPNGAFWSIAIEWQIYFLFPAMLWVRRRFGPVALAGGVGALVVVGYLAATAVPGLHRLLNLTPQFVALFAFGLAAATSVAAPRARTARLALLASTALTAGFLIVCAVQGSVWVDAQYFWIDLLVGAATAWLLYALAAGEAPRVRAALAGRMLAGAGQFSYSTYCVHLPVLWLVWHFAVAPHGPDRLGGFLALLALGVPAVYLGSYAFSLPFERPFLRHRSLAALGGALRRRPSAAASAPTESAPTELPPTEAAPTEAAPTEAAPTEAAVPGPAEPTAAAPAPPH